MENQRFAKESVQKQHHSTHTDITIINPVNASVHYTISEKLFRFHVFSLISFLMCFCCCGQTPMDFLMKGELPAAEPGLAPEPVGLGLIPGYWTRVFKVRRGFPFALGISYVI